MLLRGDSTVQRFIRQPTVLEGPSDKPLPQLPVNSTDTSVSSGALHLRWNGPFSYSSSRPPSILSSSAAETPGLYVWLVRTTAGPRLHYVGETGLTIARRHVEQFEAYATGRYSVRDGEAFRNGVEVLLCEGTYWGKHSTSRKQSFVDAFERFAPHIARVVELIDVYIAPLAGSQRLRRRLEAGLVNALYAEPSVQRELFPSGYRAWKRRGDEAPQEIIVENPPPIFGFPLRFEA